jgi:hypothetical protein
LRIEDESAVIARKAQTQKNLQGRKIMRSLAVSVEDQAINAFLVHYVTGNARTFDYLQSIYSTGIDPHLWASQQAVSLAFFSRFRSVSPEAMVISKLKYGTALRLTNESLHNPDMILRDSTLLSTLFLDLYEKIINATPNSGGPWLSHLNGALTLVKLRDKTQFERHASLQILQRLHMNLLISCITSGDSVPPILLNIRSCLASYYQFDPTWKLCGLQIEYAELRNATKNNSHSISSIITIAKQLDEKYAAHLNNMPPTWRYSTIPKFEKDEVIYNNYFHVYATPHISQSWNITRLSRILVNELLCQVCENLQLSQLESFDVLTQPRCSQTIIQEMTVGISASASQYIKPSLVPNMYAKDLSGAYTSHELSQRWPCNTLIFPLYVVGRASITPTDLKTWVIQMLYLMSEQCNLQNANSVAKILESGGTMDPWAVYASLGSYAFCD